VGSGLHQYPYSPELPGQEVYKGEFFHASKYREQDPFTGRSVVFVGLGESGADVVAEVSEVTKNAWLSLRRGAAVTPRLARGLPTDYRTTRLVYSLPKRIARPATGSKPQVGRWAIIWATVLAAVPMWPFFLVDALREIRYKRIPRDRERIRLRQKLAENSGGAFYEQFGTKSDEFSDALLDGSCELKPDIETLTPDGARFTDGTEVKADVILFCTGYKPRFPFMDESYGDFRDAYKNCFVPSVGHTLCLIGGARPAFGSIPPVAEMQARWFALLVSGKRTLPSEEEMREQIQMNVDMVSRNFFAIAKRLHYLIDYPAYMDDLGGIVGCKPSLSKLMRKPRLLKKVFCCPLISAQYRLEGPHANPEVAEKTLLKTADGPHPNTVLLAVLASSKLLSRLGMKSFEPELALPWRSSGMAPSK
jgi:dimethylaniline monooxygenase (N-oxide forming)